MIAHFREEKGPNCLRSPQLPPCDSLACHWRKKRRRKRLREIEYEKKKKRARESERAGEDSFAVQLLPWMFLDYISALPKKGAKDR